MESYRRKTVTAQGIGALVPAGNVGDRAGHTPSSSYDCNYTHTHLHNRRTSGTPVLGSPDIYYTLDNETILSPDLRTHLRQQEDEEEASLEQVGNVIRRANAAIEQLLDIGAKIGKAYGRSLNLKREVRTEADNQLTQIKAELMDAINCHESEEEIDRVQTLIMSWPSKIGAVMFRVSESRRFSGTIINEMEKLRDQGQWVINRWSENAPLDLTGEEIQQMRVSWTAPKDRRPKRKKDIESDGSREEAQESSGGRRPKKTRDAAENGSGSQPQPPPPPPPEPRPPRPREAEGHCIDGTPRQSTTTAIRDTATHTETSAPTESEAEEEAFRRANEGKERKTVRIQAEGRIYLDLIRNLKRTVRTDDINVNGVRQARRNEDALVTVVGQSDATQLVLRLHNEGIAAEIMGERKRRAIIQNIEANTTEAEITQAVDRATEGQTEVVFLKSTPRGTLTACIRAPVKTIDALIRLRYVKIGWTRASTREYKEDKRCFRCGTVGHTAGSCKVPDKVCFRCKQPGHLEKECERQPAESKESKAATPLTATTTGERTVKQISAEERIRRGTRTFRSCGVQTSTQEERVTPAHRAKTIDHPRQGAFSYAEAAKAKAQTRTQPSNTTPVATAAATANGGRKRNKTQAVGQIPEQEGSRRGQRRGFAVMVRVEGEGYERTLERIKRDVPPPEGGGLRSIRRSRDGSLLMVCEEMPTAKKMADLVATKLGEGADVKILGDRAIIKIRGLDALVQAEDVRSALINEIPTEKDDSDQIEVVRIITYPWKEKAAIVKISRQTLQALNGRANMRVGWTMARIIVGPQGVRCRNCYRHGHREEVCRGPGGQGQRGNLAEGTERNRIQQGISPRGTCQEVAEFNSLVEQGATPVSNSTRNEVSPTGTELQQQQPGTENGGRGLGRWYSSNDGKASVVIINKNLSAKKLVAGRAYVVVEVDRIVIVSCYLAPNEKWRDYGRQVAEIEDTLRAILHEGPTNRKRRGVILAGDLNSKSRVWTDRTDRRGRRIEELIEALDMVCLNVNGEHTFERRGWSAVLDVTIATPDVASRISGWTVLEVETLSDHRAIGFRLQGRDEATGQRPAIQEEGTRKWILKKLNEAKLKRCAKEVKTPRKGHPEEMAEELTRSIQGVCDRVMPRRRHGGGRKTVYWWNEEIAAGRQRCMRTRRSLQRERKRRARMGEQVPEDQEDKLREERRALRKLIRASKGRAWDDLIRTIDDDVWGKPYRIVTGKLRNANAGPSSMEEALEVCATLFPAGPTLAPSGEDEGRYEDQREPVTADGGPLGYAEIDRAVRRTRTGKAPGPDGIHPEVIKRIYRVNPTPLGETIKRCLERRYFPRIWKDAELILIPKGTSKTDGVEGERKKQGYRPISLLSVLGKTLERVVDTKIKDHLKNRGFLSKNQYGFREGLSTIDAVDRVTTAIRQKTKRKGWVAGVCIDIKNAFGSIPWPEIMEAAATAELPNDLTGILRSYLQDRYIQIRAGGKSVKAQVTRGIPQGSILGPTLWNLAYNKVLSQTYSTDMEITCYADDTLILVEGRTGKETAERASRAAAEVIEQIEKLGLQIAVEKTEVVFFTKKRAPPPETVQIRGKEIHAAKSMKYLGIILDRKLNYSEHLDMASAKAIRVMNSIGRLMPNIGGPKQARRKLLARVGESIVMYGAQIWGDETRKETRARKLRVVQRACALRVASAYRTAPNEALTVIAGIQPLEITAQKWRRQWTKGGARREMESDQTPKQRKEAMRREAEEATLWARQEWCTRWRDHRNTSNWARRLIKDPNKWLDRTHGEVNYHLTQMLTGHGTFNEYLHRFRKRTVAGCAYCSATSDSVEHTIFRCQKWNAVRGQSWKRRTGEPLSPDNIVEELLSSEKRWKEIAAIIYEIISTKDKDDRNNGF
ncbi:uncharacterized protein LOC124309685 [Neodiprion virginianus]|uniref:uncharacterized protein LOC124309685 n=1 Tax=Neodiprion virginianus TaxID=2961670 RepID=UPI001EE6D6C5|nr:uncharacterized protein LOC124309685 [Neodiprion virginianus]